MPDKHNTFYKAPKSIVSFDVLERDSTPYRKLMSGLHHSVGDPDMKQFTLKGKPISLECVFFDNKLHTIYGLLPYSQAAGYLFSDVPRKTLLEEEIKNANAALSLSETASIKFVDSDHVFDIALMFSCTDKNVYAQLIEQLGPLKEEPYVNIWAGLAL